MPMLRKLPIIGVFGAGTPLPAERARLARSVGAMVAGLGAHLLTGAGYGVMAAAAEGFVAVPNRPGFSIGIVPRAPEGPLDEPNRNSGGRRYPNPFVEIAVHTPLPPRVKDWRNEPARNHVNVFTVDAIIALPGGAGTNNELDMAAEYRDERITPRSERRTILIGPVDEFTAAHRDAFVHAAAVAEAEMQICRVLAARGIAINGSSQS
jgi:predicted Rossmann-fold nucleotide-binding protein